MRKYIVLSVIGLVIFISSCKDNCIKGDGNYKTNASYDYPEGFQTVQSDINQPVYIIPVNDTLPDAVEVNCDGNLAPYIRTWLDSKNSTLHIEADPKQCLRPSRSMEIFVYAHEVHNVISNSTSSISIDSLHSSYLKLTIVSNGSLISRALKVDDINVDLAGNGKFDLQGSAKTGSYINRGSNSLNAVGVIVSGNCSATCTGPGKINLFCDGTLIADPGSAGGMIYFWGSCILYGYPDPTRVLSGY